MLSRSRHRTLHLAFAASLLLHLLLFFAPHPHREIVDQDRFHVRPFALPRPIEVFRADQPDVPQRRMERLPSPAFSRPPVAPMPSTEIAADVVPPSPSLADSTDAILDRGRAGEFKTAPVEMADIDSLAIEAVRKLVDEYETYARFYLPDANLDEADLQSRDKAREVVERAIAAMGGWDALLAVSEMRAKVWIQSNKNIVGTSIANVPDYVYPMEYWHYKGLDTFARERIKVTLSLDLAAPNPLYALRNPPETGTFFGLFHRRWSFFASHEKPLKTRQRQEGETAHWHFVERFFGEGVVLNYIDAEYFAAYPVEVIQVQDMRYGRYYEAFFDRRSGLLLAVREGLTPAEREWYRKARKPRDPADPPVWTTVFHRYKSVDGVLTPHVLERWDYDRMALIVHLSIAYNGAQADESEPTIWDEHRTFRP